MDKIIANERLVIQLLTFRISRMLDMFLAWMEFKWFDLFDKFNAIDSGENLKSGSTA